MNEFYIDKRFVSWNMNGSLSTKITRLEEVCLTKEIICLQEHFLYNAGRNIFDALTSHMVHLYQWKNLRNEGARQVDLLC